MEKQSKNSLIIRWVSIFIIAMSIIVSGTVLYVRYSKENKEISNQQINNQAEIGNNNFVKVSVDDDPVLGDKNAPVTIIEFSDYECPFCKQSFDKVFPELKKNYIDEGKLKLVFRDFPLSFHANALKEAQAAECAKDQKGDVAYFKFHDQIFTKTNSNGTGLDLKELPVIARAIGLDIDKFQECLDSEKFKSEVVADIAEGSKAGVSGTPTYFIGKSSEDGFIDAVILRGIRPFSEFKSIIDEALKEQ